MSDSYQPPSKPETDQNQLMKLRKALVAAGLDYVITRTEGTICHVNVWVGPPDDF
jgi:hypothetical protein